ncbi:conserved Plasmodium protein, unknown function [Plasmodium vivax]|uniref:(malaria parasite P. vivax) hypothetical protein n=1 Tax=Plasmodium vivax TaxID=5855 RepID=A0A1G4HBA0_PLAVI|nr:unnamed protein product [Plasmodium vivax]SCO72172.1 conserved Plasmodium protein, unknown function [Plasmodium vivax]
MENPVRHSVDIKSEDFVVLISLQNLQTFIMIGYTAVNKDHLNFDFSYLWALCIGTGLFIYSLISFVLIRSLALSKIDIGKYVLELLFSLSIIATCSLSIIIDSFKIANMQLLFFSFALTGYAYYNLMSLFFFCTLVGMTIQYNLSFTGFRAHSTSFFFLDMLSYLVQMIGGNILYFRMYELCTLIVISKRNPCKYVVASKEVKQVEKQIFSSLFNSYMCIKSKTYSDLTCTNDLLNKDSQSVVGRDTNPKWNSPIGTSYQDKVNHTKKLLLRRGKRDKRYPKGGGGARLTCAKHSAYHNSRSLANCASKNTPICTTNFRISNTLSLKNHFNPNLTLEASPPLCKKCVSEKNSHKDNEYKNGEERKKAKRGIKSGTANKSNQLGNHGGDATQVANPTYRTTSHGGDATQVAYPTYRTTSHGGDATQVDSPTHPTTSHGGNNSSSGHPQDDEVLIPIRGTNATNDAAATYNSNASWIKTAAVIDVSVEGKQKKGGHQTFAGNPVNSSANFPSDKKPSYNSHRNGGTPPPNEQLRYYACPCYQTHSSGSSLSEVPSGQTTKRKNSAHNSVEGGNPKMDNQQSRRVSNKRVDGATGEEHDHPSDPPADNPNGNSNTYHCNVMACSYSIIKGTHNGSTPSGGRQGDRSSRAVGAQRVEIGEMEVIPRGGNSIQAYPRGRRPSAHSNCTDHLGDESRQSESKFESTSNEDASDTLERTLPEREQSHGLSQPTRGEANLSGEANPSDEPIPSDEANLLEVYRGAQPNDHNAPASCKKETHFHKKLPLRKSKSSLHTNQWGENPPHRHPSRSSNNTKLITFTNKEFRATSKKELQNGSNSNSNCKYSKKNASRQHEILDKIVQLDISNQDQKNKKKGKNKDASSLSSSSLPPLSQSPLSPPMASPIGRKKIYFAKKKKKKYTSIFLENPKVQYLFVHIPQYFKHIFDMTKKIFFDLKKKKVLMQNATWKNKIFIPERDPLGLFKNANLEKWYVSWMDEFNRNIISKTYYIAIYLIMYIITLDFITAYKLYYTTTRRKINGALITQHSYLRYYFFKSIVNTAVYLLYILFLTFKIRKDPTYNVKRYYFVTLLLCLVKLIISSLDIYVAITSLDYFISPYYVYIYIHMLIVQTSILLLVRYPTHYLLFFLYMICFTSLYWCFSIHKCFMEFIFIVACVSFTIIYSYVLCSRTVEINRRILFSKYELPYLLYLKEIAGCLSRRRSQGEAPP